ncbi:MAG: tetratricopeptide repeat protein [Candidatus Eisenbacteria bacterium]
MTWLRACTILSFLVLGWAGVAHAADPPPPVETKTVTEVRIIGVRNTPADSLEEVGFAAYSDGVYDDAETAFLDAIDASQGSSKRAKTSLAQLHSNLAWLYYETGRAAEAESLMRRAVEIERQAPGDDALPVARRTTELAMLHQAAGDYRTAGRLLDDVLESQAKKAKKADPREIAFTLHLLARNYHAAGDSKQSESFYQRALAGLNEKETMDQSQWAATMLDLAQLYHATHRDREAREAFEKALKKSNELYSAGGLSNAVVLNPYSVLQRRSEAVRATSDSSAR